ncbi:MAG: TRAP transporter substrate-binding protein [Rhodospirillales bacterium]|nr:TRAP transporter substrate-binding protein [Rhodospirillales bacterium]
MAAFTFKFGGYQSPASILNRAARILGDELNARLGDEVSFEMDGNITEKGHNATDLLTLTESGGLTLCYFSTSYLAARVPEFSLLDLPFVFDDREKAYAVMDGPLGEHLKEQMLAKTGMRVLGFIDNGFRHISNRVRPIHTPEDCKGISIRTLNSELHQKVYALMGFEPQFLDVKDLLEKVRSGGIDAQENPLTNIYNFGIHKYHRYITMSGHFFGGAAFLCHNESYLSWPDKVREAVNEAAAEATAAQRGFAAAEDAEILEKLDPSQNELVRLSDGERASFMTAVAPVIVEQKEKFGTKLFSFLEH